jgi:hypothetical protein
VQLRLREISYLVCFHSLCRIIVSLIHLYLLQPQRISLRAFVLAPQALGETAKKIKGILNKVTRENYERLSASFLELVIASVSTYQQLSEVVHLVFDKALAEPSFGQLYANMCFLVNERFPSMSEPLFDEQGQPVIGPDEQPKHRKITFKSILLIKCQEEFESMQDATTAADAAKAAPSGSAEAEEAEHARIKLKQRKLGNIKFICELFKQRMLSENIIHRQCIAYLLSTPHERTEEEFEALCKILSSVGETLDHERAKQYMDLYFEKLTALARPEVTYVSSRIRFMLLDLIDLRRRRWKEARPGDPRPRTLQQRPATAAPITVAAISNAAPPGFRGASNPSPTQSTVTPSGRTPLNVMQMQKARVLGSLSLSLHTHTHTHTHIYTYLSEGVSTCGR